MIARPISGLENKYIYLLFLEFQAELSFNFYLFVFTIVGYGAFSSFPLHFWAAKRNYE